MRFAVPLCLLLLLSLAPAAGEAQTAAKMAAPSLTQHQGSTAAPAVPPAPAIIPGSPLAAIANATGAATTPAAGETAPAPFGTQHIGFILSTAMGSDAMRAYHHFWDTVQDAMRLTPLTRWYAGYQKDPQRGAEAKAILFALLGGVLPAVLVDALLAWLLRGPAARCAQWAERPGKPPQDEPAEAPAPRHGPSGWGRRLGFATLRLLLALVPIAAFVLTVFVLLNTGLFDTGTLAQRQAVLAATGVSNAYFACRLVQELGRFLFNPGAASLRLVKMPAARAQALMRWLLLVLITFLLGAGIISCALALGMTHEGIAVITRFTGLAIHIEAAIGIWQGRAPVAGWIAGAPGRKNSFTWLRKRLARVWHIIAIFYVLAIWVAWTAGVHNAFVLLLRSILVLVAAVVGGALVWKACLLLLERYLNAPDVSQARYPNLITRLRVYRPLLGLLLRGFIIVLVVLVILQGWGVDALGWLGSNTISQALLSALGSVLSISAIALLLWEGLNFAIHARVERLTAAGHARRASRLRTLTPILRGAAGTVIFVAAFLVCLSRIGVNTTGLLAVSSIAGIAVGFGSQTLVRDIITGLFMLLEDAVQVGDVVTLAGMSGTVERLTIRTIYLRGSDGSINIIPFSSVTIITNATRDFSNAEIALTVGNGEDLARIFALLTDIGRDMRADGFWGGLMRDDLQIFGLDKFTERGMVITGQIRTMPGQHAAVRREFYKRVQQRFHEEGILLPVQQTMVRLEMPPAPPPAAPPS